MKKLIVLVSLVMFVGFAVAQNHEPTKKESLEYKDSVIKMLQDSLSYQDSLIAMQVQMFEEQKSEINNQWTIIEYLEAQVDELKGFAEKNQDGHSNLWFIIIIYMFSGVAMFVFGYLYHNKKPKQAK